MTISIYVPQYFQSERFFESASGVIRGVPIQSFSIDLTAATANQTVISAVAGKNILVISAQLAAIADTDVVITSAGVARSPKIYLGTTGTRKLNETFPPNDLGWWETDTGSRLAANCGANAATLSIRYIAYTPSSG